MAVLRCNAPFWNVNAMMKVVGIMKIEHTLTFVSTTIALLVKRDVMVYVFTRETGKFVS